MVITQDDGSCHAPNLLRALRQQPQIAEQSRQETQNPTAEIGQAIRRLVSAGHSRDYIKGVLIEFANSL